MTELKLEIPYAIFNSDKVNENKQDEFKKLLIDNEFNSLNLDFDDAGSLTELICYSFTRKEINGVMEYKDDVDLAEDLYKLLKENDYLDLDLIKEHFKDDYLVYVYPTEIEPLYSARLEQLEEE